MSYDREHLRMLPPELRRSVSDWIEQGEPHPRAMGSFFRAVLCNKLVEAYANADAVNTAMMRDWATFLYEYAPGGCWGDLPTLEGWYAAHHPKTPE